MSRKLAAIRKKFPSGRWEGTNSATFPRDFPFRPATNHPGTRSRTPPVRQQERFTQFGVATHPTIRNAACLSSTGKLASSFLELKANKTLIGFVRTEMYNLAPLSPAQKCTKLPKPAQLPPQPVNPCASRSSRSMQGSVELPVRHKPRIQRLLRQTRPHHLHRNRVHLQNRVVEVAVRHLPRPHQILVQRAKLQRAQHIRHLIQRPVIARFERSAHFARGVFALEPDAVHQEVHALLRAHLAQVKTQREDDARAS